MTASAWTSGGRPSGLRCTIAARLRRGNPNNSNDRRSVSDRPPVMTPAERAAMLDGMRSHAPAPVFEGALQIVRPHLSDAEWAKLARALGLAQ